jgi:hypothetical protein
MPLDSTATSGWLCRLCTLGLRWPAMRAKKLALTGIVTRLDWSFQIHALGLRTRSTLGVQSAFWVLTFLASDMLVLFI